MKPKYPRESDRDVWNWFHINQARYNHQDPQTIENVNVHLMHSILTESVADNKDTCVKFYNLEMEKHENNEAEILWCMKKNLDPTIVKTILDAKFPGCTDSCIKNLQKLARRPFIIELMDKITKSEKLKESIALFLTILKIEAKYVDQFKDLFLSLLMLKVVGGYESVVALPDNFTTVMVVIMFGSLILPLLISSLHLAVNNPFMILRSDGRNSTKMSRCLSVALCFLLSAANPIFLEAYYDEKKEEVRTLMQNYNTDAISALKTCKQIKRQSVEFLRIELGFYHFSCFICLLSLVFLFLGRFGMTTRENVISQLSILSVLFKGWRCSCRCPLRSSSSSCPKTTPRHQQLEALKQSLIVDHSVKYYIVKFRSRSNQVHMSFAFK